ncbi:hypothetical protein V6N13_044004 [Hibiscus sabdariffa]
MGKHLFLQWLCSIPAGAISMKQINGEHVEREATKKLQQCVRIGRLSLQKPENYTKWDPYLTAYPYLMISFFFFWAQTNKGQKLEKAKKNQHKQLTMVQHHAALLTDAADPQQRASELILQPTDHILVPNKAP